MSRERERLYAALGASLLGVSLLIVALIGNPPYAFYGGMKWVVVPTGVYLAAELWRISKAALPVGLLLIGLAAVHAFGRMRRMDWAYFNVAMILAMIVGAAVLLFVSSRNETSVNKSTQ